MAHFRATIKGNRGEGSRLGTEKSGIEASVNGWNTGIDVYIKYDFDKQKDFVEVYKTGGSNNSKQTLIYSGYEF